MASTDRQSSRFKYSRRMIELISCYVMGGLQAVDPLMEFTYQMFTWEVFVYNYFSQQIFRSSSLSTSVIVISVSQVALLYN